MTERLEKLKSHLAGLLAEKAASITIAKGELMVCVTPANLPEVAARLKSDPACQFDMLIDICGVDYPERTARFDVVYNLLSLPLNNRIRLKVQAAEGEAVPSLCGLYPAANWFEREAYDLYGIVFSSHPDLRRILTDYGFEGHPLRKDFPLTGYMEVRYDEVQKRIVYEPVKLQQDFRNFDYLSPWEGMTNIQLPGDEKAKTGTKGPGG